MTGAELVQRAASLVALMIGTGILLGFVLSPLVRAAHLAELRRRTERHRPGGRERSPRIRRRPVVPLREPDFTVGSDGRVVPREIHHAILKSEA